MSDSKNLKDPFDIVYRAAETMMDKQLFSRRKSNRLTILLQKVLYNWFSLLGKGYVSHLLAILRGLHAVLHPCTMQRHPCPSFDDVQKVTRKEIPFHRIYLKRLARFMT